MRVPLSIVIPLALGCRSSDPPKSPTGDVPIARDARPTPGVRSTMPPSTEITEVSDLQPLRGQGGVAVAGTLAGVATPAGVELWDLAKRTKTATVPLGPELRLVSDGDAIVIVTNDRAKQRAHLTRVTAGQAPVTHDGAVLAPVATCVVPTAQELYVVEAKAVSRLKLPGLDLAGFVPATRTIDGCARLGEGVAFIAGGSELVTLDRAMTPTRYQPGVGQLVHVAAAGADRVWVSTPDAVHLLELKGATATRLHDRALPGIYHVAGAGPGLAVLTVTMRAGAWATLTLHLVGSDGAVRWSKVLPVPSKPAATSVAASAAHVAVVADGALHVFAAHDGAVELP